MFTVYQVVHKESLFVLRTDSTTESDVTRIVKMVDKVTWFVIVTIAVIVTACEFAF